AQHEQQAKPAKQQEAKAPKQEQQAKPEKQQQARAPKQEQTARPAKQEQAKAPKQQSQAKPARQQQEAKASKQESQAKPAKQQQARSQQQRNNSVAQQQQAKGRQQQQGRQQQARSSHAPERTQEAMNRQREQPALRLSARGSGRIPEARFRSNFGRGHEFHMGNPVLVGGYSRFQYGGFWFGFVQPWPTGWYYTDDVYIDYVDGGYYMFDPYYPGARFAISVVI
ncbi:MAG: cell envelope integrity protein TolA, partial [Candidatus Acidiferrum sp.]